MSAAAREGAQPGPLGPRRLVLQATGSVVRVGELAEVFGGSDRAVLRLERDGAVPEELLLLRLRHGIFALVNRCPHLNRALEDGQLRGHVLRCPGHGRSYNVRTGRAAGSLPGAGRPLRRVRAWADAGQLFLDLTPIAPK